MVLQRSVLNWRRGCNQSIMGMYAFIYLSNLFGVVIFHRSMLDWRRGWCKSAIGICVFFYMTILFVVVVLLRSMPDLKRGWSSVCHGYMCILQYVKLIWCSGSAEIYAHLEERV